MQTGYTGMTFSPKANPASPAVLMFFAALISRSCSIEQSGQVQLRTPKDKLGSVYPQQEQRFELGKNWSIFASVRPAQSALYSSCWTNRPHEASAICLLNLGFLIMFFTFNDSTQTTWLSLISSRVNLCKLSNRQSEIFA